MPKEPRMTDEKVTELLLDHACQDLTYIRSEAAFYQYHEEQGYLEYIDPEFDLPRLLHARTIDLKEKGILQPSLNINPRLIGAISTQLTWITPHIFNEIESNHIAFSDGILIDTTTPHFTRLAANRNIPAFIHFPFPSTILDDDTPPKRFLEYLNTSFEGNQELVLFVQRMMGYILLDTIDAHAVFFLTGSGQNGKSVLLHVIEHMLPTSLISASSIQNLTSSRFGAAALVGKRLNSVGEEESKYIESSLFKSIVTGDTIQAERKFLGPFKFRPRAKLLFSTNKLPNFNAVDEAMRRRLFIIPFDHYVPKEKRDPHLRYTLVNDEMPQIIRWALEGAKHVIADKFHFERSKAMQEAQKHQEEKSSSAIQFFNQNYEITKVTPPDFVTRQQMYQIYKYWCEDEGRHPLSRTNFFDELMARYKNEGLENPDRYTEPTSRTQYRALLNVKPTEDSAHNTYGYANNDNTR